MLRETYSKLDAKEKNPPPTLCRWGYEKGGMEGDKVNFGWLYFFHPTSNKATKKKMNSSVAIGSVTGFLCYGHTHNTCFRNYEVVPGSGVEE